MEVISNGVTAFHHPESRECRPTMVWMSVILGTAVPGHQLDGLPYGVTPEEDETVLSQLARADSSETGLSLLIQSGAP